MSEAEKVDAVQPADPAAEERAKRAQRMKAANQRRRQLADRRRRVRELRRDPEVRRWNVWNHDLDTLLHELVKNPALATADPRAIVARAADFADALRELQDARRPPGVPSDADEF